LHASGTVWISLLWDSKGHIHMMAGNLESGDVEFWNPSIPPVQVTAGPGPKKVVSGFVKLLLNPLIPTVRIFLCQFMIALLNSQISSTAFFCEEEPSHREKSNSPFVPTFSLHVLVF
jgi:hypothetical protein